MNEKHKIRLEEVRHAREATEDLAAETVRIQMLNLMFTAQDFRRHTTD